MMNFSGQNRGFAYAKYGSQMIAETAIQQLDGHVIEPGVSLGVRHSTEKRKLCLGGLPGTTMQAELLQVPQLEKNVLVSTFEYFIVQEDRK